MSSRAHRSSGVFVVFAAAAVAALAGCGGGGGGGGGRGPTPLATSGTGRIFAATAANELITFEASAPGVVRSSVTMTGLQASETIAGMDFRPATGQLYAAGSTGRVYLIDRLTGAATQVGAGPIGATFTGDVGFDFNPVPDRIRFVASGNNANLRLNPDTGAVATTDTALAYAAGTPEPGVAAVAYTNSFPGATSTTLFGIDADNDLLVRIGSVGGTPNSPNGGTLTSVGALGVDVTAPSFDIAGTDGPAYLVRTTVVGSSPNTSLYTVNLSTGAATLVGVVGMAATVTAMAIETPTVVGLTNDNTLISFNAQRPGTILGRLGVSGLQASERLVGIDFRPATGQLFGLGDTSRLYTIDLVSGAATAVTPTAFTPALNGTKFGFDFNPTVDRIRVVSNLFQNLRLNPATGTVAATDPGLNPGTPNVVASAYTNPFSGAAATTLFGIDTIADTTVTQNPTSGALTTVGLLNFNVGEDAGFDIAQDGVAYASLVTTTGTSDLYTINLTSGAATRVGQIGTGENLIGIAVPTQVVPVIFALTASNKLTSFAAFTPGTLGAVLPITGLQASETILGIDFRPANGKLYGLGSTSRVYVIDTGTGAATAVTPTAFTPALSGGAFGFDVNPLADRLRIVSDAGQSIRVHPDTGAVVPTDTALNGATNTAVAAAYTNSFVGTQTTTLFDIDANTDALYIQNPPNNGTLSVVGFLGTDTDANVGFDITPSGLAFASLTAPTGTASTLRLVNLQTGSAATSLGTIGGGEVIRGIAVKP
jgi:trimeric autotransporter adhesin